MMKELIKKLIPYADIPLLPFVYLSALLMKTIRKIGIKRLPRCREVLMKIGVFPISDHYYEPQFDNRKLVKSISFDRQLPGINWNKEGQLKFLKCLIFSDEIINIDHGVNNDVRLGGRFQFNNGSFESVDAEYWYQIIRYLKPKRIIEIGSGNSTKLAIEAIKKNIEENSAYYCDHICIEPYEQPWLEKANVKLHRQKVEDMDVRFFAQLEPGDILFIDSSHVIRPGGDVLKEYLEILPSLKSGVIVHIHDIFSPKNYLREWLIEDVKFWNEQYILEAFLTNNHQWKILGALNFLHHNYYNELKKVAPHLSESREPGSFYIVKN